MQEDLTAWLVLAIMMENGVIAAFILAMCVRSLWLFFIVEKKGFERLQYEDIEEDW